MICTSLGYPDVETEIEIIKHNNGQSPLDGLKPVVNAEELLELQKEVEQVFVHDDFPVCGPSGGSDERASDADLGISPRGTIALTRMAKASAYIKGRNYVVPTDVPMCLRR